MHEFITILENENDMLKAMALPTGILLKSVTKSKGKAVSESMIFLQGGVVVNHGTEEKPIWKLTR